MPLGGCTELEVFVSLGAGTEFDVPVPLGVRTELDAPVPCAEPERLLEESDDGFDDALEPVAERILDECTEPLEEGND